MASVSDNLRRDQWSSSLSYLWIDGLEARLLFIHLEVELGGGDGQGAFHHRSRSHQLSAGAQVYWAWRKRHMPVRKTSRVSLPLQAGEILLR